MSEIKFEDHEAETESVQLAGAIFGKIIPFCKK